MHLNTWSLLVMVLGEVMKHLGGGGLVESTRVGCQAPSLALPLVPLFALFMAEYVTSQLFLLAAMPPCHNALLSPWN